MDKELAQHASEILKAIANPVRLQIIEILEANEKCVGDIVDELDEQQAIVSQQLNLMKDKGILQSRRDGVKVYYSIENKDVIKVLNCVYDHCDTGKKINK